jgi:hypothetical protein
MTLNVILLEDEIPSLSELIHANDFSSIFSIVYRHLYCLPAQATWNVEIIMEWIQVAKEPALQ